jgi:4-hydroxy-tetrahydrodipicolinate synthase
MPGVGAYGGLQSKRHAEVARDLGCQAVMGLPPNAYRTDERSLLEHFELIASAGLPVTAYNNPIDTKTDLTPPILAKLYDEGFIVGVKEFSGDVRRCYEISELAPGLDLMIGTDDTVLEVALAGAKGWVAGYPQVFPQATLALYEASLAGDLETPPALPPAPLRAALGLQDRVHPGDQAWPGHDRSQRCTCRPPRQPLTPEQEQVVRRETQALIDAGVK